MNEMNELKALNRNRNILLVFTVALFYFFLTWLIILTETEKAMENSAIFFGLFFPLLLITLILWGIIASKLSKCLSGIKRIKELMRIPTDYTEVFLLMANNKFDEECRKAVSSILIKRGSIEDIDIIYTLNDEVRYLSVSLEEAKKFLNLIPFSIF